MPAPSPRQLTLIKLALFLLCLTPALRLSWAATHDGLGANPVEFVQRWTGTWTLNLLLLTLCITPLRAWTQAHWLIRLRRMLGLFTFFYAVLHGLAFFGFDHDFVIDDIARDVLKRPFVTAGFAAFLLLIPLAATSNQWAIRKLGGRKWQELHRSIYLISLLGVLHYYWLVKATALLWPIAYSGALLLLLGWRIRERFRKAIRVPPVVPSKPLRFFREKPE